MNLNDNYNNNEIIKISIFQYNNIKLIYSEDILFFYALIYYKYGEKHFNDIYIKKLIIELLESTNLSTFLNKIDLKNQKNEKAIFTITFVYYSSINDKDNFPFLKLLFKRFIENKENEETYRRLEAEFYNYSLGQLIKFYNQSSTFFLIFNDKEFSVSLNYINCKRTASFYNADVDLSVVSILTNEYKSLIIFIHELSHQYYHELEENRFQLINENIEKDNLLKKIVLYLHSIYPENYTFFDMFSIIENNEAIGGNNFDLNFSEFIACFISYYFFPLENKLIGYDINISDFDNGLLYKIYIKLYRYINFSRKQKIFHNIKKNNFKETSFLILLKIYLLFKLNKFYLMKEISI
jgi:hypothetical protein